MNASAEIDTRVAFLIEWLVAAVLKLHERKISPGLVQMIVDRLEEYGGTKDALGLKMTMTGLGMKADWAWEEGRLDEAQALFENLMSLVEPDGWRYYLEVMGLVRVLFDKGEQAVAFDLIGRSALTAMNAEEPPVCEPFEMLSMVQFGDLAASVKSDVFLEALGQYESRYLADKNLGLAELWRREPQKALDILLDHSPHPPSTLGPDAGKRTETGPDLPGEPDGRG